MSGLLCQPTFLDSPLLSSLLHETIDLLASDGQPRNVRLKYMKHELKALQAQTNFPLDKYSTFSQNLIDDMASNTKIKNNPMAIKELTTLISDTVFLVKHKLSSWSDQTGVSLANLPSLESLINHPTWKELQQYFCLRWELEKLVLATARPKQAPALDRGYPGVTKVADGVYGHLYQSVLTSEYKVTTGPNFTVLQLTSKDDPKKIQNWVVTRNHLLGLSDLSSQRFICLLSSMVESLIQDSNIPDSTSLLKVFKWGDDLIQKYGNEGFNLVKMWEPLIVGYILKTSPDGILNSEKFWNQMVAEFVEIMPEDKSYLQDKIGELTTILDSLAGNPHHLSQLHGLYRIWGHPSLDGIQAVNRLIRVACQPRETNPVSIRMVTCRWRELFSLGFWSKYHRWPVYDIASLDPSNYLHKCLSEGILFDVKHPDYDLFYWENVKFGATFTVPDKFNFSELLSDKALSLNADELYEATLRGTIGKDRSVILKWLESNFQNPREFLDSIDKNGFSPQTNVVGVYPKEREMKIFARLFGLMPLEKRLYIIITEALLAEEILPCLPEITMTMDEKTLLTKIHAQTKTQTERLKTTSNKVDVVVNLDFEKWNSYMREEETNDIFTDFDHLFGLNKVFSRTHELFKDSYFYLADGTITPVMSEKPDGTYYMKPQPGVWTAHLGGIEGLRQKGWTIFTVSILKHVSNLYGTECRIMGQGDNQVLFLTFSRTNNLPIQEQLDQFLTRLNVFLETIGPPIKPEECWASSTFFTYGKLPVRKGVPLSMSLKKLCRMFRLNNDDLVNLDSTLGSISSNAASATKMSATPVLPLWIAMFESLGATYNFLRYPFYHVGFDSRINKLGNSITLYTPTSSKTTKVNQFECPPWMNDRTDNLRRLAKLIVLVPSALGGYSTTLLNDLLLHGFPDPVTLSIHETSGFIRSIGKEDKGMKKCLRSILTPKFNNKVNAVLLMENPTALNLLQCSRCKDRVRALVFDNITKMDNIQNQAFIEMLNLAGMGQEVLAQTLYEMEPLKPRVGNSIFESTVPSQAMAMIRRIDRTSTLINVTAQRMTKLAEPLSEEDDLSFMTGSMKHRRSFLDVFARYESQHMSAVISTLLSPSPLKNEKECGTYLAALWRQESWQKELEGVTVPFPAEIFQRKLATVRCEGHDNEDLGYILVLAHLREFDKEKILHSLGPFKPFFGTATREKVQYDGKKFVKVAPPILRSALENLRFINWGTDPTSNLSTLIKSIVQRMTDVDPDILIPSPGQATGTDAHRWANSRTSHESTISVSYLPSTHFCVNTNYFHPENLEVMEGSDNHNISFQSVFSWIAALNSSVVVYHGSWSPATHYHVKCRRCIRPVNEDLVDIPDDDLTDAMGMLDEIPKNEYTYIPLAQYTKFLVSVKADIIYDPPIDSVPYHLSNVASCWVISQGRTKLELRYDWSYLEVAPVLPVSTAMKLPMFTFFRQLTYAIVWKELVPRLSDITSWDRGTWNRIHHQARHQITSYPPSWFFTLESLFLNDDLIMVYSACPTRPSYPKGHPPSKEEYATSMKDLIVGMVSEVNQIGVINWIKELERLGIPEVDDYFFHPLIISVCLSILQGGDLLRKTWILKKLLKHVFPQRPLNFSTATDSALLLGEMATLKTF